MLLVIELGNFSGGFGELAGWEQGGRGLFGGVLGQ